MTKKQPENPVINFPGYYLWIEAIKRWSPQPPGGAKTLICAILAQAITDAKSLEEGLELTSSDWLTSENFNAYCAILGICPVWLRERITHAESLTKGNINHV